MNINKQKEKMTIVSNFPFQNRSTSGKTQHKIWIKFTQLMYELLGDDDVMLLVSPQSWGSPSNKVLKIFQDNPVKYINFDSGMYFPQVGSSFSDYMITKNGKSKEKTEITINGHRYKHSFNKSMLYVPVDIGKISLSIHEKVIFSQKKKLDVKHDYVNCHNILLKRSDTLSKEKTKKHIHPVFHTNKQIWHSSIKQDFSGRHKVMWTRSGYTKPFYDAGVLGGTDMAYYVLVDGEKDGKSLEKILNTDLFQYIFKTAKWSGFGNEKVFAALPDILGLDFSSEEELNKYFGLTEEEINYIKNYKKPSAAKINKIKKQVRSKERSDEFGEVFTPEALVNEMLSRIPQKEWENHFSLFIDPACGNGNFLVEVVRRKIQSGAEPLQALMTTYGVDIMPDNIAECRQRLVRVAYELSGADSIPVTFSTAVRRNIKLGDTLSFEIDDIFDKKPSKELRQWRQQQIKEINS